MAISCRALLHHLSELEISAQALVHGWMINCYMAWTQGAEGSALYCIQCYMCDRSIYIHTTNSISYYTVCKHLWCSPSRIVSLPVKTGAYMHTHKPILQLLLSCKQTLSGSRYTHNLVYMYMWVYLVSNVHVAVCWCYMYMCFRLP